MSEQDWSKVDRRQVVRGAGLLAGATAALGVGAGTSVEAAETAEHWDMEADIVVVGGGCAGCTAAITAVDAGNSVILLEKAPALGGTTNRSGGVAWIPNHHLLRKKGIEDKREDALRYMTRFAYAQQYTPDSPTMGVRPEVFRQLEAFYDNGSKMIERLGAVGALNWGLFSVTAEIGPPPDYADHLPENKVPSGRAVVPIDPDGKPLDGIVGDGAMLIEPLENWLVDKNVPLLTEHAVTNVIQQDGRVIGVEAYTGRKTIRVRAKKGVIFGTGGYAHNEELVDRHQKALYGSCAVGTATGDFITIAGEAGAKMGNLGTAWRSQVVLEEVLDSREVAVCAFVLPADSMVVVNKYGKRVFDEKRNYNDRTELHFVYDPVDMEYPNQLMFMVFDGRSQDAFGGQYPISVDADSDPYLIQGADLDELTANIAARLEKHAARIGGVTLKDDFRAQLGTTIENFNGYAETGVDEEFGRGGYSYDVIWASFFSKIREGSTQKPNDLPNKALYPLKDEGPYYAVILAAGALDTSGGPAINEKAEVLAANGKPIPGLYGAGNCIASPSREAYFGAGGTIGLAMTYGYIAALSADAVKA